MVLDKPTKRLSLLIAEAFHTVYFQTDLSDLQLKLRSLHQQIFSGELKLVSVIQFLFHSSLFKQEAAGRFGIVLHHTFTRQPDVEYTVGIFSNRRASGQKS